jgi:hypothetical protein
MGTNKITLSSLSSRCWIAIELIKMNTFVITTKSSQSAEANMRKLVEPMPIAKANLLR